MSGLSAGGGGGGQLIKTIQPHGLGIERVFLPDVFRNPNKNWPVEVTPLLIADRTGGSGSARVFPPDVSSGVALHVHVPAGASQVHFRIPHRAGEEQEGGSTVAPRIYAREADNQDWAGPMALGTIHIPPNDLYQAVTFPALLGPLKLKPDGYAQFLFVRHPASRVDTLECDWLLFGLGVTFV